MTDGPRPAPGARAPPRRLLRAGGGALLAVLVAPSLLLVVPQAVGGDHADVVRSGSMAPAIQAGDLVVLREADPAAVRAGDVIAFRTPQGERVLHRVVAVHPDAQAPGGVLFTTRGDANAADDAAPVAGADLLGVYAFRVPAYGHVVAFARGRVGILLLVVLPALVVLVRELRRMAAARAAGPTEAAP